MFGKQRVTIVSTVSPFWRITNKFFLEIPIRMTDNLSSMKKVNSREFQKSFSKLTKSLKPGESIEVTKHGKPIVQVTKAQQRSVKLPDFAKNLKECGIPKSIGNKMLE